MGSQQMSTSSGLFSQNTSSVSSASSGSLPCNPFLAQVNQSNQAKFEQQQKQYEQLQQQTPTQVNVQPIYDIPLPTQDDILKFKADVFIFGQIPTCPPPLELCH